MVYPAMNLKGSVKRQSIPLNAMELEAFGNFSLDWQQQFFILP
jgi:hypothetical protein